jgi:hypothetical protein
LQSILVSGLSIFTPLDKSKIAPFSPTFNVKPGKINEIYKVVSLLGRIHVYLFYTNLMSQKIDQFLKEN